ncbi:TPA: phage tail protein [Citrobacter amalonaticus]
MATKYLALLTNIGAAKLAKATALGTKVEITQMAVGDGNGVLPTPNPAQTALVHELRRAPLNMLTVDPANASQIIAEQVVPEDVGGWWIREIGLFDKDGDMVAIANCAETYKPQLQEGSGRVQVIRVILIVSSTEAVTIKIDPSVVLATRKYVDDKIIEVKAYADDLLVDHIEDENPHSQYPLIANALKEMADAGLVDKVLENLQLGEAAKMPAASLVITGNTLTAKIPVIAAGALRDLIIHASQVSSSSSSGTITFPSAFPNACIMIIPHDFATAASDLSNVRFYMPGKSSAVWYGQNMSTGNETPPATWGWFAIGW